MSNVLSKEKKQQVIARGRLGWSLRRIQEATRIRRETAGGYLRAAEIAVRPPGGCRYVQVTISTGGAEFAFHTNKIGGQYYYYY